ncbi:hypothetical protein CVS40_11142 [Lucilia cuprina]|nr:hypothetical protein CVS40_11142 [Lucilia cuprina]
MDKEAVNAPKEDEFHSLIKSIDIDNYLYVMPIIEDSIKLKNLASQIHQLFPNEAEEVYFEKQKHQRAKGKLFYRHQNAMKSSVKPITKPIPYIEKKIYFLGNEQDASKIKSFLKYNF